MLRSRRVWRRLQVTRRKTWSTNWLNTTDILTKLKSATERSSRRSMLISQRQMFSHKVISINKIEKNFSQYFVRCIVDYRGRFFISPFSSFSIVYSYLCGQPRSNAPHTPRIVLLGPTGSGKGVQAALLANKYNIVNGMESIFIYCVLL